MKIGIITFWESQDNYGQLLQCWALQQLLKKMGHEPFLIRYSPIKQKTSPEWTKLWKAFLIYPILRKLIRKLKEVQEIRMANAIEQKNAQRKFDDFRKQYIIVSDKVYHGLADIKENPPVADCYICGSDQVWSKPLTNDENQAFYLNFGKKNRIRIAYAASFGRDVYPVEQKDRLHDMLVKFDAISVREKSGIDICANVGIKAVNVLDPTLLLPKEDYHKIMEMPKTNGKYFYTYSINVTSSRDICWKELSEYAYQAGLLSISTTSSGYFPGREICPNTQYVYATIPQWLGYINHAEFMATTSFHGIAFCLILHKNFIYFPLKGKYAGGNSRVVSLLESLGLHEKIFNHTISVKQCIEHPIDWDFIELKLHDRRDMSYDFLNSGLL